MPLTCPICQTNNEQEPICKVQGIWPRDLTALFCRQCSSYYLENMPNDEEYRSLYRLHYYQSSVGRAKDSIKHIFREFRTASQADFIRNAVPFKKPLKILEVGAGDGRLLAKLLPLAGGHIESLHGLELSPYYVQYAQKKWGLSLSDSDFFTLTETYDLILMSHVFEHFTDLTKVIAQVDRLLTPRGCVFIEVPHSPSPGDVSLDELRHYLTTTHTYNFTAASIRRYWERCGYDILASERSVYRLPPALTPETRTRVAKVFLEGAGLGWSTAWHALSYLTAYIKTPEKAYTTIPWDAPYWGPGDSVRLLVQRPRPDAL